MRPWRRVALLGCLAVLAGCASDDGFEALGEIEDRRLPDSQVLIETLGDGTTEKRTRAARAMGRIQSPSYASALAQAASAGPIEVRRAALFALGQLGLALGAEPPAEAPATAVLALDDDDVLIVRDATEALGKLAAPGTERHLIPLLRHADAQVREAAAHALFRLRFVPLWREESEQPPELSGPAVAALAEALVDAEAPVRRAAAHAFSRYGEPRAVAELIAALGDADPWVRMFAARALGRSNDRAAVDALASATADSEAPVRTEATAALGALAAADRLPFGLAEDPSFHVRAALATALVESREPQVEPLLRRLADDPSTSVRAAAIESLARRLGDAERDELIRLADDKSDVVRAAGARAMRHLSPPWERVARQVADDPSAQVRLAALETLVEGEDAAMHVLKALESPDLAIRGTALERLESLELPDRLGRLVVVYDASEGVEWVEIREGVIDAVAAMAESSDPALTFLRRVADEDEAAAVRLRARRALTVRGVELPASQDEEPLADLSPFLGTRFEQDPIVVIETSKGTFEIRCFAEAAPVHVAAFVHLVGERHYDGLLWHRVVPNFVIQGGDPRGDGWGGAGFLLRDEINREPFERGTVGMPKGGKDTGGGQLFVTHVPTPHLDGNYTAFGRVVSGLDVIDRIEVGDRIERAYVKGAGER